MKKRIALIIAAAMVLLSGCGRNASIADEGTEEMEDNVAEGIIDYETSSLGIDSNAKDFLEKLTDNSFYVVHDGIYYPIYTYFKNEDAESDISSTVDEERMVFYTVENYNNVPTLFPGDHLVYYSTDTMLDVITWERYKPLGITFGMFGLQRTTGGRYYLDFSDEDVQTVIPDGSLTDLYDLAVDNVTIDKIGGVPVDDDVVADGIIIGATEGKNYDVEVYTGTYYKHYTVPADTFAFKAYELFKSTGCETLQDCFWEIDIPDYFVNGYYDINGQGIVRIMREQSYSNETEFSEQLIYPDIDEFDSTRIDPVKIYSENEELNEFKQTQFPEELGYEDPDGDKAAEEIEELAKLPEAAKFKEANIKEYELWFPEGKQCTIEIESKSGETSGSAIVTFDTGGTTAVTYNRFDKVYTAVINGKGNTGVLTISGFWYDYDIHLTNAEIYNGQDMETEAVDSTSTKDSVPEEENSDEEQVSTEQEDSDTDDELNALLAGDKEE